MLTQSTLAKLDALALVMRSRAGGSAGGARRSRALGTSAEFSDYREYAPGDDLRRVDWNAYARFQRLFLKLFMEERETRVHVLVDASASMEFPDGSKWRLAQGIAEAVCYLALKGGDRVSLVVLRDGNALPGPHLSGRAGALHAAQYLAGIRPGGRTSLAGGMKRLSLPAGRGMTVLLSDLMDENGYDTALKSLLYRKQELSLVHILSREELAPDYAGAMRLEDCETGGTMDVMMNADTMARYESALKAFLTDARAFCVKRGISYAMIAGDTELEAALLRELPRAGVVL